MLVNYLKNEKKKIKTLPQAYQEKTEVRKPGFSDIKFQMKERGTEKNVLAG